MTGLSHDNAKRLIHAAGDRGLNPAERAALDTHLTDCKSCRAYQTDMGRLDVAISHALRTRWSAPRRSSGEISAQIRTRMMRDTERQFLITLASALVKLSSVAVVVVVAAGLLQGHNLGSGAATPAESVQVVTNVRNGLPAFEFESDGGTTINSGNNVDGDSWPMPATFPLGSHVMYY
jgi:predicted anti-sigma-YlaC factor YlaD